jgi:hypothetical protein
MNTFTLEHEPLASNLSFSTDSLTVHLNDGRHIAVPLAWYPRLLTGTKTERENYNFIGSGEGIHWPDLDEDIRVEDLLSGWPSQESRTSLKKWLQKRRKK